MKNLHHVCVLSKKIQAFNSINQKSVPSFDAPADKSNLCSFIKVLVSPPALWYFLGIDPALGSLVISFD